MLDTLSGKIVTAKLWARREEIEPQALAQLTNIAALPWAVHVAVMPDVHYGKGATVGSVIGLREAVSPAAVGVDIGCGCGAIKTSLYASDLERLPVLRSAIEAAIPVGFNKHPDLAPIGDSKLHGAVASHMIDFDQLDPGVRKLGLNALAQFGTLGGGNHFIELCVDQGGEKHDGLTEPRVWMMLHSGSRNIGKMLAEIHIAKARTLAHNAELPDPDLAVFLANTPEMAAYRRDLYWAQEYARLNRLVMFDLYKRVIVEHFGAAVTFAEPITCHHNYVSEEIHFGEKLFVTRKGAIEATRGKLGIIPGSMGTRSYIVRGLGNAESLNSASHGAGRRMSRGAAKRKFTVADLARQTTGIECRKDVDVIDEIPEAYKNIGDVMAAQSDLVEIVHELSGVLCVKG